ncbi:MAG: hypothetical protein M3H12_01745, partial [Chromatiales bacterium]
NSTKNIDRIWHPTKVCGGPNPLLHLHAALCAIFRKHQLKYHLYVDGAQMFVGLIGARDGEAVDVGRIERSTEEVRQWMSDHNLLLNETSARLV